MREHVQSDPELAWALEPAERPGRLARVREKLHLVAIPLLLLPLAAAAAPRAAVLRGRPRGSTSGATARRRTSSRTRSRILELAALEDHLVQNPFTAVGHVKPGRFRRLTLSAVLFDLNYATRHIFNRGNLSGVKTIHFARWVFIDGKRRMFFASNYDGSMESYMDDFIDKVAWGLNLVFSNGVGYPKTRWLVFGGAKDELAFKDFLRVHQVPTPGLVLRLRRPDRAQHRAERADPRRPARAAERRRRAGVGAVAVKLELGDVQGLFARGYGDLKAAAFLLLGDRGRGRRAAAGSARRALRSRAPRTAVRSSALNLAFTSSGLARLGLPADAAGDVLERVRRPG